MKKYNVAVVGAMGVVGSEMIRTLEKREFPVNRLIPLDTPANKGKYITFNGENVIVEVAERGAFKNVDIAFFSAGGPASALLAPIAVEEGCIVVDNSSQWRMDEKCPLVVPEVNPQDLDWHNGIIANPNCSTVQMMVALKPIHDKYTIKRIVVSTYQAVSGSGMAGINELNQQSKAYITGEEMVQKTYPHQIYCNAIPHIDVFLDNGYTKEEMKMVNETKKIMDKNIEVSPTAVRIPVYRGHSESINIETEKPMEVEDVIELLKNAPGLCVVDDPSNNIYPLAINAEGKYEVLVGRIRKDNTVVNGLNMWVVSDNLLKGAALNAIQIGEMLIKRNLI